jgi:branched-subunit amino acid transport protein
MCIKYYVYIHLQVYICRYIGFNLYKSNLTAFMVYIDRYIPVYMFKHVYVHIRVRQQLEYTLKLKIKKKK